MNHHNMKKLVYVSAILLVSLASCTSTKELSYLNNLPETGGEAVFTIEIPDYKIQYRDNLYVTARAMSSDGVIADMLSLSRNAATSASTLQDEAGQFLLGYDVNSEGNINIPAIGSINVLGMTLEEARNTIQTRVDKVFLNTTVECKLLSFKFTVIGEVRVPGTYINYNNYLTVFEAIGRAGSVTDFGQRDKVLVIRSIKDGTKTYKLNLQDKAILSSEAYFLLPNDVVIVEAESKKVFNLNLPTYAFLISSVTSLLTTTLLLMDYFSR